MQYDTPTPRTPQESVIALNRQSKPPTPQIGSKPTADIKPQRWTGKFPTADIKPMSWTGSKPTTVIKQMTWTGSLDGSRGYQTYKLMSSNTIGGVRYGTANYLRQGMFRLFYRLNTAEPLDRKEVLQGIRKIIPFKGRHLFIIDRDGTSSTLNLFLMIKQPSPEKMAELETYLDSLRNSPE